MRSFSDIVIVAEPSQAERTAMAASTVKKEMRMRLKVFRGAKAWIGAMALTRRRMVSRLSGRKMLGLLRFVKSRVFEGGVGWTSGGSEERSRVRLDFRDAADEARERGDSMLAVLRILCRA